MTNKATWEQSRTDAISKMFENVDEHGIYPTTKFFEEIDKAHYESLLSQRKELMEAALAGIPPEKVLPKDKCLNLENHMYGSCFQCERLKGFNDCRQEVLTLITSILSQDI